MSESSRFPSTNGRSSSFNYQRLDSAADSPRSYVGDFNFGEHTDRRFAFSRQPSFHQNASVDPRTPKPLLSRNVPGIDIPQNSYFPDSRFLEESFPNEIDEKNSIFSFVTMIVSGLRSGNRHIRRLFVLIFLNVAYSTAELFVGLFSGRIGLVSDAFHLTFGCGLLSFSLSAMAASQKKPDRAYTYGYKRLSVLAAFTNATAVSFVYVILLSCGSTSRIHTR